ncbi:MAG: response regulator transcription factor [Dehalococcoidia bacterium]|nr:response regulator transcription factor [Dehalococcoidia bacterium]
MTTIVLADDHLMVRQGVKALLCTEPDFQIIGEAGDGTEAAKLVESLKPDVLVTDLKMPEVNGIELTRQTRELSPKTAVVILSIHGENAYVFEALRAGARGYVLKESISDDLANAIRAALCGNCYLSPPLTEERVKAYGKRIGQIL